MLDFRFETEVVVSSASVVWQAEEEGAAEAGGLHLVIQGETCHATATLYTLHATATPYSHCHTAATPLRHRCHTPHTPLTPPQTHVPEGPSVWREGADLSLSARPCGPGKTEKLASQPGRKLSHFDHEHFQIALGIGFDKDAREGKRPNVKRTLKISRQIWTEQ